MEHHGGDLELLVGVGIDGRHVLPLGFAQVWLVGREEEAAELLKRQLALIKVHLHAL